VQIAIDVATDEFDRAVLAVRGAIDLQTRDELLRVAKQALADGTPALVLDLEAVGFIDSTGIGALVELGHDAEDVDAGLVLRRPSDRVLRILKLTGLTEAWTLEHDPSGTR
jgi:anti-sigma B factor antagonist